VLPYLWTPVGSTVIASVPTGDLLVVSNVIVWPAAQVPPTGHYCFVAIAGHALEPAPAPADFQSPEQFWQYVRNNNNVTWKNFNVVLNVFNPASAVTFVELPFSMNGTPDHARPMGLEIVCRLPIGSAAKLQVPETVALLFGATTSPPAHPGETVEIAVNASGSTRFPAASIPANASLPLKLLVRIHESQRQHAFEVFARQLYQEVEVGRVTWRLVPQGAPA